MALDLERTQSHESDGEEEHYLSDNFTQSERHKKHLSSWLDKLTFENKNNNKAFFKETAVEQLLLLLDRATIMQVKTNVKLLIFFALPVFLRLLFVTL